MSEFPGIILVIAIGTLSVCAGFLLHFILEDRATIRRRDLNSLMSAIRKDANQTWRSTLTNRKTFKE